MSEFIFRMPEHAPDLDFESLEAYIRAVVRGADLRNGDHAEIGTTVRVTYEDSPVTGVPMPARMTVRLYGLRIAAVYRHAVYFQQTGDAHMATTEWIAKVVRDNAIGTSVFRVRRRKSDPLVEGPRGYMGPLAIGGDRDRLVEGYWYRVGDIEGQRRQDASRSERALTDPELDDIRPGLALDLAQLRKTGMDKPGDYLASTYED
jgi:hypothetical protein